MMLFQSGVPYSHLQCVTVEVYLKGLLSHSAECCTPERDSPAFQQCRTFLKALELYIFTPKASDIKAFQGAIHLRTSTGQPVKSE